MPHSRTIMKFPHLPTKYQRLPIGIRRYEFISEVNMTKRTSKTIQTNDTKSKKMIFAISFFLFTIFNTIIVSSAFIVSSSLKRIGEPEYIGIAKQQQQQQHRTYTTSARTGLGLTSTIMTTTTDKYSIRKVELQDLSGLKDVLDSSELFPSDYLDDMISDYFSNPDTEDIWFTTIDTTTTKPIAIGYCSLEKFTVGTYNLYAIAVQKNLQHQGIGTKMIQFLEQLLLSTNKRILLIDTSSDDKYTNTRKFYLKLGYRQEATIKDFWDDGDDKITFYKKIIK